MQISCQAHDQSVASGAHHVLQQVAECHVNRFFLTMSCCITSHSSGDCAKNIGLLLTTTKMDRSGSIDLHWCPKVFEDKNSMSASLWCPPTWSNHPSHLCAQARSRTSPATPPGLCSHCGGRVSVVTTLVFFTCNVKPTCASEATRSPNKRQALSNVCRRQIVNPTKFCGHLQSTWMFRTYLTKLIGMHYGISEHLIWILQCGYYGQTGAVW